MMTHRSETTQIYNDDRNLTPFGSNVNKPIVRFVMVDHF